MKHLPKHLQPRWRYLAVAIEAWPDAEFDRRTFQRELWFAAQNLVGDAGSAAVDLSVLRFALADGAGHAIIRARRGEVDRARAVIACLDAVDGHPLGVRVAGVSGTVRACEEKYIRGRREGGEHKDVVYESATRRAVERGGVVDVRVGDAFLGTTHLELCRDNHNSRRTTEG